MADETSRPRSSPSGACRRELYATIAGALVVAFVVAAPVLRFRWFAGDHWDGVWFLGASDAEQYLNQLRQVLDGRFGTANDILWEWGRGPAGSAPLAYTLFVLPCRVLGGSLHMWNAVLTALGAAVQFVLLARIARRLGAGLAGSLATALACCLVANLWAFHGWELWLFHPDRAQIDFLPLYRPMNPSLSSLIVWGPVLAILHWFERPRSWVLWGVVTLGAIVAFEVYLPAFTVVGGIMAAAAAVLLCQRRWRDAAVLAMGGVVALAVVLPQLWWVVGAKEPGGPTTAAEGNVNAIGYRALTLPGDVATGLGAARPAPGAPRGPRRAAGALLVTVGAPLVFLGLFNQHLVTGRIYQPFHYDWFYSVPFLWLAVAALAPCAREPLARLGHWLAGGLRWKRVGVAVAVVMAIALAGAALPRVTGAVLHGVGVLRSSVLLRPALFAILGVAVPGGLWFLLWLLRGGRLGAFAVAISVVVGVTAIVEGWRIQDHAYRRRRDEHMGFQKIAPALRWVEANADPEAVVACANGALPRLFTSYSGRNVYVSLEVIFYNAPPEEEYLERRLLWLALYGVTREELAAELGDKGRFHYDIFKWRTFGPPPPKLAFLSYGENLAPLGPDAIPKVLAQYDRVLAMSPAERLARYRLDYVLWSDLDSRQLFRDPSTLGYPLESVLEAPGCRLYRVVVR